MSVKLTKEALPSETLEWLLTEAVEFSKPLSTLQRKLLNVKAGTEPYLKAQAEIAVAAEVLKAKLNSLISAIGAVEDSLPDED